MASDPNAMQAMLASQLRNAQAPQESPAPELAASLSAPSAPQAPKGPRMAPAVQPMQGGLGVQPKPMGPPGKSAAAPGQQFRTQPFPGPGQVTKGGPKSARPPMAPPAGGKSGRPAPVMGQQRPGAGAGMGRGAAY